MRVMVFAPYAHWRLHVTDLEVIQKHVARHDEVIVLTCRGEMTACDNNPRRQAYRCVRCIGRGEVGLRLIQGAFRTAPYYCLSDDEERQLSVIKTDFTDASQLKHFHADDFDVGWAVLSSLVTRHRDPEVDLRAHAFELDGLIRGSWSVYYSIRRHLRERPVDRVYVFNGRYAPLRAAFRACQSESTECMVHDVGHDHRHYALYRNALPHDRRYVTQQVNALWEAHASGVDRDATADRWYAQRARGQVLSGKCFVDQQVDGRLPDNWIPDRRNIAVFTSSEDEFAAIGESWLNPLYESQLHGLRRIVASLSLGTDAHLYVRIHPNLSDVDNRQTRELFGLNSSRVTVIPPDHPTCTYALMRHCHTVLSFGSTAGIEATYWGRPSILAGMAYYRDLGATYIPSTHDELVSMLCRRLEPLDRLPARKYGFYQATFGEPYQYYSPRADGEGWFNGRRLRPTVSTWFKSRMAKYLRKEER